MYDTLNAKNVIFIIRKLSYKFRNCIFSVNDDKNKYKNTDHNIDKEITFPNKYYNFLLKFFQQVISFRIIYLDYYLL